LKTLGLYSFLPPQCYDYWSLSGTRKFEQMQVRGRITLVYIGWDYVAGSRTAEAKTAH